MRNARRRPLPGVYSQRLPPLGEAGCDAQRSRLMRASKSKRANGQNVQRSSSFGASRHLPLKGKALGFRKPLGSPYGRAVSEAD